MTTADNLAMKTKQTASESLHPPVIAGVSTGGESWGFFDSMKTIAESQKENDDLRRQNEMLKRQLRKAINAFADVAMKLKESTK